jgi:hypothetical protein
VTFDKARCVYCTRTNGLIDIIQDDAPDDVAIARAGTEYGPDLVVIDLWEATQRQEAADKSEPVEITAERFDEMLNILPPVGWTTTGNGESFKMCERYRGRITSIFVKLNQRHFTFMDSISLPHDECCTKVFRSAAYRESPAKDSTPELGEGPEAVKRQFVLDSPAGAAVIIE